MEGYNDLVDIGTVKQREKSSRTDNAFFFLEQIKTHKKFRVGRDVVELGFPKTDKTLAAALAYYLEQKSRR
ncbi:MAG: hypothetical protein FWD98_05325 [Defluviitaleaceae bacterium]|nr:hypothetical protein [Defluviitaleaceae bacterium]